MLIDAKIEGTRNSSGTNVLAIRLKRAVTLLDLASLMNTMRDVRIDVKMSRYLD
jgi:hypothetical protein